MPRLIIATHPRRSHPLQTVIDSVVPWRRIRLAPKGMPLFGGHFAVTRSACAGLARIGADWAYATDLAEVEAEVVVVLAGVDVLRAAIAMKRSGRCARLFAGPNICEDPRQHDAVLQAPEIDGVIVPGPAVGAFYVNVAPALRGRTVVWAAGVDPEHWRPSARARDTVLVYAKSCPRPVVAMARRLAKGAAQRVATLSYGSHTSEEYRAALDRSSACIFLTGGETQGIALAEAWAMDVPTWVPRRADAANRTNDTSSAPYLSDATGRFWLDEGELAALLAAPPPLSPRDWVLANMTDAISARNLLRIVGLA